MSNRATIEPTEFKNVRSGKTSVGVRVYDNDDQAYDNSFDSIPDDDMEVLRLVAASENEIISGILDFVVENESGIYIGDNWYEWDDIKAVLNQ